MSISRLSLVVLGVVLLAACAGSSADIDAGRRIIIAFFEHLNKGEYATADTLYGGPYDVLIYNNPSVNPNDHVTLWRHACTINGYQCLTVRSVTFKEKSGDEYIYVVEFNNPDGSLFVRGPCCGASETDMPSQSRFEFHLTKTPDGRFKVLDEPVYVP